MSKSSLVNPMNNGGSMEIIDVDELSDNEKGLSKRGCPFNDSNVPESKKKLEELIDFPTNRNKQEKQIRCYSRIPQNTKREEKYEDDIEREIGSVLADSLLNENKSDRRIENDKEGTKTPRLSSKGSDQLIFVEKTNQRRRSTTQGKKRQLSLDNFISCKKSIGEPEKKKVLCKEKSLTDALEEMEVASKNVLRRSISLSLSKEDVVPISRQTSSQTPNSFFIKKTRSTETIEQNLSTVTKRSSISDLYDEYVKSHEQVNEVNPSLQKLYEIEDKERLLNKERKLTGILKEIKVNDETFEEIRKVAFEREVVRSELAIIASREKSTEKDQLKENDRVGRITLWRNEVARIEFEPFNQLRGIPDIVKLTNLRSYPIWINWWGNDFCWKERVDDILNRVFHHKTFRLSQYPVINSILAGHNVLVLMPTGGGKSLCYQLPSLFKNGYTIVVSPLISLMQDQVKSLNEIEIPAITCNSSNPENFEKLENDINSGKGKIKIVYVSPECIDQNKGLYSKFNQLLKLLNKNGLFSLLVIDEAHCISQCGHDFRPSYENLYYVRKEFPTVQTIMFTATATERVKNDILLTLGIEESIVFDQTFNRPNLFFEVKVKKTEQVDNYLDILNFIQTQNHSCGIVFCFSRKDCDLLNNFLRENHVKSASYHAKLLKKERKEVQDSWMNGTFEVICATIAFGMGIDKPDVRYVIHHTMPSSIEQYFQEAGRAGRDGKPSTCVIYYCPEDVGKVKGLKKKGKDNSSTLLKYQFESINAMTELCETQSCRRQLQLGHFQEIFEEECTGCDNCKRKQGRTQ